MPHPGPQAPPGGPAAAGVPPLGMGAPPGVPPLGGTGPGGTWDGTSSAGQKLARKESWGRKLGSKLSPGPSFGFGSARRGGGERGSDGDGDGNSTARRLFRMGGSSAARALPAAPAVLAESGRGSGVGARV